MVLIILKSIILNKLILPILFYFPWPANMCLHLQFNEFHPYFLLPSQLEIPLLLKPHLNYSSPWNVHFPYKLHKPLLLLSSSLSYNFAFCFVLFCNLLHRINSLIHKFSCLHKREYVNCVSDAIQRHRWPHNGHLNLSLNNLRSHAIESDNDFSLFLNFLL